MNLRKLLIWSSLACCLCGSAAAQERPAVGDSRGDDWTQWINGAGEKIWGVPPEPCDDWTFARRVYMDVLGRPPSVAEIRDYESLDRSRRRPQLVEQLVFGEGPRPAIIERQAAQQFARVWTSIFLPNARDTTLTPSMLQAWLVKEYRDRTSLNEIMRKLVVAGLSANASNNPVAMNTGAIAASSEAAAGEYYQRLGGLPENYAGNVSRVMLGVRIECAQCHDHPFSAWKMQDFWGLAAFYADAARPGDAANSSTPSATDGEIKFSDKTYHAKLLWHDQAARGTSGALRQQLGRWITSADNPNFSATMVNRFWQQLVGRGLFVDVENLDTAKPADRKLLDEFGARFAADGFDVRRLTAAICKSNWYQAISQSEATSPQAFYRPLKAVPPDQLFDAFEQSLHLPISRIDPNSPRWSGAKQELVNRLSESGQRSPDDYAAGIPQALLLMNGRMTSEATNVETSRLLRAVIDSPFMNNSEQIDTLYLAILSRRPTADESKAIEQFLASASRQDGMSNLVWALINSPEFALCR